MCLARFKLDKSTSRPIQRWAAPELTSEYNRMYPPGILQPILKEEIIKKILIFLEEQSMVESELLSFTNEPIPVTKFYSITNIGFQEIHRR